ncbi:MAG: hypothetical protein HYY20_03675, partial [Candidatus Tectomicrobia bacterium]|nr:hypothetical protein [Candidatus Tectomicrobia bacterium]
MAARFPFIEEVLEIEWGGEGVNPEPPNRIKLYSRQLYRDISLGLQLTTTATTAGQLEAARARRLIDVAGGSGIIAVELAELSPSLEAVVFDLPLVCEAAREVIEASPAVSRVKVHPGFDLAILSSILHALGPDGCCSLIRETFECLHPGGCIAVLDCLLNQEKGGPPFAALF